MTDPDVRARPRAAREDEPKEAWRLDDRGQLDDVVVPNVAMFRMERMSAYEWWIGLYYPDGRLVHIDLFRGTGRFGGLVARRRDD
jgi:hypothetical protein